MKTSQGRNLAFLFFNSQQDATHLIKQVNLVSQLIESVNIVPIILRFLKEDSKRVSWIFYSNYISIFTLEVHFKCEFSIKLSSRNTTGTFGRQLLQHSHQFLLSLFFFWSLFPFLPHSSCSMPNPSAVLGHHGCAPADTDCSLIRTLGGVARCSLLWAWGIVRFH